MTEDGVQLTFLFFVTGVFFVGLLVMIFFGPTNTIVPSIEADPKDRRAGPGRSNWRHVEVCTKCREITGYQEFMTKICLSCGQKMESFPRSAAVRNIFWHGQWREQLHDQGHDYIRQDKKWLPWPDAAGAMIKELS